MKVTNMKKYDLEERLIDYAVSIVKISTGGINKTNVGQALALQLGRSGTSVALNYAEAQSAESRRDFIHKMKVALKELRETYVCLRIVQKAGIITNPNDIESTLVETNELISIFVKSVETAKKNLANETPTK
jgi:four helix bundle protein